MSPLNFSTTLIAQAKSNMDATISVQDVIDIEVDYTASIKVPLDLFNNLIYFSSDQNIDNQTSPGGEDSAPDLELAMDAVFFDKFLELEYNDAQDNTRNFTPPFGTIPFSQSKMSSGQINPPSGGQSASESQDDLAGKHLGIWICRQLFGETGFGIVSNFEHLIKDTINLNSALNDSTVRMVKQNGGFLPAGDPNRNTGGNSNGGTYLTPSSEGSNPREAIAATSFQGPNSNNIGYQIINSGLTAAGAGANNEMFDRLVRAVRKVTEPKRMSAANTKNLDPNEQVDGVPTYPTVDGTGTQIMKYGDVLLNYLTHEVIKTQFVHSEASSDPSTSSQYVGRLTLTDDMKAQVVNAYGVIEPDVDDTVTVPEVVYDAWMAANLDLHEFCLLNEFVHDDTVYMLTAVASENSAVLRTGALGGAITENTFQPDIINRVSYASKSTFFNNSTNPKDAAQVYQQSNSGSVGGLYDGSVEVNLNDDTKAKLLGWRVGGHTLKLTDKLNQHHVKYLAAWAYVVATAQYCQVKKYKDGIGMGPEGGDAPNPDAVKALNPNFWRVIGPEANDVKLTKVAKKFISAECARRYQIWFDELTSEQYPVTLIGSDEKEQIKNFAESKYNENFRDEQGNVLSINSLVVSALKGPGEDDPAHELNLYLGQDDGSGVSWQTLAVKGLNFNQ